MKKIILVLACSCLGMFGISATPVNDSDRNAIEAAVLDYVEGIYEMNPERIARSVDVTLRKYGYGRPPGQSEFGHGREMNYKQLYHLAANWNKKEHVDPATGQKEVTVLDMYDKTASAKLVAFWGIDYFHLAKEGDKWKIINVIWQSHPLDKSD